MVEMRLDTRLQARVDASDVVQEAFLDVVTRLDEYLRFGLEAGIFYVT